MASRVLVVGSINVDLYQKMSPSSVQFGGQSVDVSAVKGMTLPAKSFVETGAISEQISTAGLQVTPGNEEAFVLTMNGPFVQKTGGKGANAAAAAGQTFSCELICNFGRESVEENKMLLDDLKNFGNVDTGRSGLIDGPTGTAYILLYGDNDNAIVLLGGANQSWPESPLDAEEGKLRKAIAESVAVMLQREVPENLNVEVAKAAHELGKPVFMDVGGTDAPLDERLLPFISVICPNESELKFVSGVETMADGEIKRALVRQAVEALQGKFAAAGNAGVEVLVTLGSSGSMHFGSDWTNKGEEDASGFLPHECYMGRFALATENGRPKDTTGAGDCFRGSYVAARYGELKSVSDSMRWATAAGSLAVEVEGAMPSMPTRAAIEARASGDLLKNTSEFGKE
jgi:ribokinase